MTLTDPKCSASYWLLTGTAPLTNQIQRQSVSIHSLLAPLRPPDRAATSRTSCSPRGQPKCFPSPPLSTSRFWLVTFSSLPLVFLSVATIRTPSQPERPSSVSRNVAVSPAQPARNHTHGSSSSERGGIPSASAPESEAIELLDYPEKPPPPRQDPDEQRRRDKRETKRLWLEAQDEMKFSHSIQFNAVPDWSSHYIAYSNLKKL